MGITNHVRNLRKRPEKHKRRIALLYSGGVTGVIFIVWLSVLLPRTYERTLAPSPQTSTLAAATSDLQQQFGDLQQKFNQAESQFPGASQAASVGSAFDTGTNADGTGASGIDPGNIDASSTDGVPDASQPQYDFGY